MDFRFRLLVLVILSLIHYTAGITFYLSSSIGDDKANGTSPTSPWQSLTRASLAVSNGQAPNATLLLLSGDTFLLETAAFSTMQQMVSQSQAIHYQLQSGALFYFDRQHLLQDLR